MDSGVRDKSRDLFHIVGTSYRINTFYGIESMNPKVPYLNSQPREIDFGAALTLVTLKTAVSRQKFRIPTVKLEIPGKAFLKTESWTSVTFKL